jgi:hypothetical protein
MSPGHVLADELVAGLLDCRPDGRTIGLPVRVHGHFPGVDVDGNLADSREPLNLSSHGAGAVAARHTADRVDTLLHIGIVAMAGQQ